MVLGTVGNKKEFGGAFQRTTLILLLFVQSS